MDVAVLYNTTGQGSKKSISQQGKHESQNSNTFEYEVITEYCTLTNLFALYLRSPAPCFFEEIH